MRGRDRHRAWTWIGAATLVAVAAAAATTAIVSGTPDVGRVQAIMFAAGVCLAGSLGGWLVGRRRARDPGQAVAGALAAVCLRFFPALGAVAWLQAAGGRLRDDGAAEWLLIFYLAVLATDILLHIMGARSGRGGGAGSAN